MNIEALKKDTEKLLELFEDAITNPESENYETDFTQAMELRNEIAETRLLLAFAESEVMGQPFSAYAVLRGRLNDYQKLWRELGGI
jgi:hypothetical protein